ncbi:NAD(P)/FAD-dependent oxidoreductase [Variovorax ginsengisoli]|uniref:3-phenylpropionate/trans-cinnamate dioxygenase ferredoxin reductase subunit n=1 Tax=Variovorax ginsengisoli TaxID=363844 RepID=A0ABT9S3J2_9BURK|nr:FAD-dependent oxidoreductase [Variovorax ginsengisoli]MDP9898489.1 3-phenylpropionate/trans-cinnamate dioxygenase ferredoxin reductase subunit [Variovorax ginsengisoli]
MPGAKTLVIVGASYAGVQLAATARELGFEEPITILGDERHAPYQRPPLSKGLLTGKTTVDQLQLRGPDFFTQNRIDLQLGQRAAAVDAGARTVTLADGRTLGYGWLALTTGARCRPFTVPGAELDGVVELRTLDDALRVADAADRTKRACVIGGGFIGLEVASALRTRGVEVTVVEAQPHLLTRSFPPIMSAYVENAHRRRGIELLTGRGVRALHGTNGQVDAVELTDGHSVDCDLVVLGVGVLPNVELAQAAGIAVDNGIVVDAFGRTSAPRVLSAGDVASMALVPVPGGPTRVRLESIQAANDGARAAASAVVGREQPNTAVPWFWSDQFDLKFQMAGLPVHGDEVVTRGDIASDKFSLFYLRDGVLVGAHSVNKPAEHMQSRKLIAARAQPTAAQLADTSFDLKNVPTAAT